MAVVIPVPLDADAYEIHLGSGLLDDAADRIRDACPAARYAVISDTTVAPLYAERLAAALDGVVLTFPTGEASKTRKTWGRLTDAMVDAGVGRDGAVVAVGGGVVGDVAGFVAATYHRGVPYVQIPTSLLAMLDSAIGGKTGIDTPSGKNLVGAFHQPRIVIADVDTLTTLPDAHLRAGLAEAIKHAAIGDADYLETMASAKSAILERDPTALTNVVQPSMTFKADVVLGDERERGRRAVLNFGHTVGHAVEAQSDYRVLHGEAVAVGMCVEAAIGVALGVTDDAVPPRLTGVLADFDLPTAVGEGDPGPLIEWMRRDKKVRGNTIRMTLLGSLGRVARAADGGWTHPVPPDVIAAALDPTT